MPAPKQFTHQIFTPTSKQPNDDNVAAPWYCVLQVTQEKRYALLAHHVIKQTRRSIGIPKSA
jgi:hypothetical protein